HQLLPARPRREGGRAPRERGGRQLLDPRARPHRARRAEERRLRPRRPHARGRGRRRHRRGGRAVIRRASSDSSAGFTLVEVMIALSILFAALVVLLRGAAMNIAATQRAHMLTAATELARSKM